MAAAPLPGRAQAPAQRALDGVGRAAAARNESQITGRYDDTFRRYSKRYFGAGFDWRLFKAQAMAESQLNPQARSWVGARGLMQLMPSTFAEIQSKRPEFESIDDPEWNIAAGIMHDRYLWRLWAPKVAEPERAHFMFGSYNAGEGTIGRATATARASSLDQSQWASIEEVAPTVPRWRYRETIGYVRKIEDSIDKLRTPRERRWQEPVAAGEVH